MLKGKISSRELFAAVPAASTAVNDLLSFDLELEVDNDGDGNNLKAIPKIHDKWTDGLNLGDISKYPGIEKYMNESQPEEQVPMKYEAKVIEELVKMADNFDRDGDDELASEIDEAITSFAARPKAPLKDLDDEVKKGLIIFVDNASKNTKKSIEGLNELFRRLRYFDMYGSIKEMGLEKTVTEMGKIHSALADATKKLYEMTHGKRPSKDDMVQYLDDGQACADCGCGMNTADFFAAQEDKKDEPECEEDEACDNPGEKVKSDGEGKGLARGDGEGPVGEPIDEKSVELDVEMTIDEEDIEELIKEFWD